MWAAGVIGVLLWKNMVDLPQKENSIYYDSFGQIRKNEFLNWEHWCERGPGRTEMNAAGKNAYTRHLNAVLGKQLC